VRRDPRSPCSQRGAWPPVQRNPAHGPWCSGTVRGQWPACPWLGAPSEARPCVSLHSPARLSTPNTARVGPRCGSPASLPSAWLAIGAAATRSSRCLPLVQPRRARSCSARPPQPLAMHGSLPARPIPVLTRVWLVEPIRLPPR
jgi:hypothetical protein